MSDEVSIVRLYFMRGLYLLNFVVLGLDVWPALINHTGAWDPVKGVAFSWWATLSLLSALGFRYPLQMLPLLLAQMTYKIIWLVAIALREWTDFSSIGLTKSMLIGLPIDLIVIPWPYVLSNYVKKRGDRWR